MPLDLDQALREYRAGLDAEIALLRQLERVPIQTDGGQADGGAVPLAALADERDTIMAGLVALEHDLRPLRARLAEARPRLQGTPGFETVAALHRVAGDLVARILANDAESLKALESAESARRFAAESVEKGESTLAAYRRVVAPRPDNARIVNRRG
jgi:hypothetical protein